MLRRFASMALAFGCAGGQTGEITMRSACDEVVATHASDALPSSIQERTMELSQQRRGELSWVDGESTTITISIEPTPEEEAMEIGGPGCEVSRWRVPARIELATADGLLDDELVGWATLHPEDGVDARATVDIGMLQGALGGELEAGELIAVLSLLEGFESGQLFMRPHASGEEVDETVVASWR